MFSKNYFFIFVFCFFGILEAQAHQLKCAIYDLAYGDNLVESEIFNISSADLKKNQAYRVSLNHELISADFSFQLVGDNSEELLFQVQTHEVTNAEYAKFLVSLSKISSTNHTELGYVFTEISGFGDNTKSFCSMIFEKEQF